MKKRLLDHRISYANTVVFVLSFAMLFVLYPNMVFGQGNSFGCFATAQACIDSRSELEDWAQEVIANNPDAIIDGVSVSNITTSDIVGGGCQPTGNTGNFCMDSELETAETIYNGLSELTPDDEEVPDQPTDTSGVMSYDNGDERCYTHIDGDSETAQEACQQEAERVGKTCYLDQSGVSESQGYCVQTGADDLYIGTGNICFNTEPRCFTAMQETYGEQVSSWGNLTGEVRPGQRALCREEVRGQGQNAQTEYCMNDEGLTTRNTNPLQIATNQDRREDYLAQLAAQRAEFDAREAAGDQALRDTGALVQCSGTSCDWEELIALINRIIRFMITIASVIVVLMIIWAGWKLISARGNPQALTDAKSALWKGIAGFVLVLTAWLIVDVVSSTLLDDEFESDAIVDILGD